MESDTSRSEPVLIESEAFLARLREEIARSDRYEHAFTLLVLRPPASQGAPPPQSWLESLAVGMVRGCDVVTVFDGDGVIIVLLPETGVIGGSALLERFRTAVGDTTLEWQARLLEYPTNGAAIRELAEEAA